MPTSPNRRRFLQAAAGSSLALFDAAGSHSKGAAAQDVSSTQRKRTPARGPLTVHPRNPRYFTDGSGKAVYLTGSHTWTNLIDRGPSDPPPVFDFERYLDFLELHHHNFIRLWGRQLSWYQKYGSRELHAGPLAWSRTGPGNALDGKPKFDLTKLDPAYFQRLRARVRAASDRGIYVSIMLFGGFQDAVLNWSGSPFHRNNNVNGVDGDPNRDGSGVETQTLAEIPKAAREFQQAYVRKVVDTVNDLDNVLFEISNESGESSWEWQYDLVRFINTYERSKQKQHPVGITATYGSLTAVRKGLDASPAAWVSYQLDTAPPKGEEVLNVNDPFPTDGRKVSLLDSDHWWVKPLRGNPVFGRDWVWKGFCRGHHPILMEHLPPLSAELDDLPFAPDDPGYVASRKALGHTRRYAERLNLAAMTPSQDLASSTYCLADPGQEYLVYQPNDGAFNVNLEKGSYTVEWFNPAQDRTVVGDRVTGGAVREFKAPFPGAAVLYLRLQQAKER